jgi:hypothetical protein
MLGYGDRCKLNHRLPPWHGEPILIHGEPGRDDYWTDLEREQFESNAEREGTKIASWSRRI